MSTKDKIIAGVCSVVLLLACYVIGRCTGPADHGEIVERVDSLGREVAGLKLEIAGQLGRIEQGSHDLAKRIDDLGSGQGAIAGTVGKLADRLSSFGVKLDRLGSGITGAQGIVDQDGKDLERLHERLKQLADDLSGQD